MRLPCRTERWGVWLFCGLLLFASERFSGAQADKERSSGKVLEARVNLPGKGEQTLRLRYLPPSAIHRGRPGSGRQALSFVDPIVFSSASDYDYDTIFGDALYSFPTLGYDPGNIGLPEFVPNTLEGGISGAPVPPASANFADVYYGQLGTPSLLTTVTVYGGMADINTLEYQRGLLAIIFYNGVDAATPPQGNPALTGYNLARTEHGNFGYVVEVPAPGPDQGTFGPFTIDLDTDRLPIANTQGKFGILTAKFFRSNVSSPASVQWLGFAGSPNGPNRVYRLTAPTVNTTTGRISGTFTPHSKPADNAFNQSAEGTVNYMVELRGVNINPLEPAPLPRGILQGNIRRRGLNVPAALQPESAPGFYRIAAFKTTGALVREDFVWTQPSYDETGSLTINYILEGYPAGTYDIEVSQQPIFNAAGRTDILSDRNVWPFSDSLPARTQVTVTDYAFDPLPTELNVRLERFGDIDDGSGVGVRDGAVDALDLAVLINAFNTVQSDTLFNRAADIAGDSAINGGRPDGAVDAFDLAALINAFNSGSVETP